MENTTEGQAGGGGEVAARRPVEGEVVAILVVVLLLSLCGNSLVVAIFPWRLRPRTAFNVFVTALAVLDLLTSLVALPSDLMTLLAPQLAEKLLTCQLASAVVGLGGLLSLLVLLAIAGSRYRAVCRPQWRPLTPRTALVASLGALLLCLPPAWPPWTFASLRLAQTGDHYVSDCGFADEYLGGRFLQRYYSALLVTSLLLTLLLAFLYFLAGRVLWRQNRVLPEPQPISLFSRKESYNHMLGRLSETRAILASANLVPRDQAPPRSAAALPAGVFTSNHLDAAGSVSRGVPSGDKVRAPSSASQRDCNATESQTQTRGCSGFDERGEDCLESETFQENSGENGDDMSATRTNRRDKKMSIYSVPLESRKIARPDCTGLTFEAPSLPANEKLPDIDLAGMGAKKKWKKRDQRALSNTLGLHRDFEALHQSDVSASAFNKIVTELQKIKDTDAHRTNKDISTSLQIQDKTRVAMTDNVANSPNVYTEEIIPKPPKEGMISDSSSAIICNDTSVATKFHEEARNGSFLRNLDDDQRFADSDGHMSKLSPAKFSGPLTEDTTCSRSRQLQRGYKKPESMWNAEYHQKIKTSSDPTDNVTLPQGCRLDPMKYRSQASMVKPEDVITSKPNKRKRSRKYCKTVRTPRKSPSVATCSPNDHPPRNHAEKGQMVLEVPWEAAEGHGQLHRTKSVASDTARERLKAPGLIDFNSPSGPPKSCHYTQFQARQTTNPNDYHLSNCCSEQREADGISDVESQPTFEKGRRDGPVLEFSRDFALTKNSESKVCQRVAKNASPFSSTARKLNDEPPADVFHREEFEFSEFRCQNQAFPEGLFRKTGIHHHADDKKGSPTSEEPANELENHGVGETKTSGKKPDQIFDVLLFKDHLNDGFSQVVSLFHERSDSLERSVSGKLTAVPSDECSNVLSTDAEVKTFISAPKKNSIQRPVSAGAQTLPASNTEESLTAEGRHPLTRAKSLNWAGRSDDTATKEDKSRVSSKTASSPSLRKVLRTKHSVLMMTAVTLAAVLSYLPYLVLTLYFASVDSERYIRVFPKSWFRLALRSPYLRIIINPIAYAFCHRGFQRELRSLLSRIKGSSAQ